MLKTLLIGITLCIAPFIAFANAIADDTKVRFINDWKWEGQAAPLLLALDEGFFSEEGLDASLHIGKGSLDAIPKVASGEFDMGSADINSLITWRDKNPCLLYTSPSPRDKRQSRMPSSA